MGGITDDDDSSLVVYDIRSDFLLLSQIAEASVSRSRLGLGTEHGVVGSADWWEAVRRGQVPVERFVGTIIQTDGGINNDSCLVRVKNGDTTKSWVAWEGFKPEFVGEDFEIIYAKIAPKVAPRPGFMVELILQVRRSQGHHG
jgi:hypothetical protein